MKKIIIILAFISFAFTSCIDRSIIDSKEGPSLPAVSNLAYTRSGNSISLTWTNPTNIPPEIKRPLRASVQVHRWWNGGVLSPTIQHSFTVEGEPSGYTFTLTLYTDPDLNRGLEAEYHVIVKLVGDVANPIYGYSPLIYSLGQTVIIK